MKKAVIPCAYTLFFIVTTGLHQASTMPSSDAEASNDAAPTISSEKTAASGGSSATPTINASPAPKAEPLKWPDTIEITEDSKKLLQSNNKEIVQLFTLAQDVCKDMDDTLSRLNTMRDTANTKYRDTIKELDPLVERIGAAQAENKNR